MLRKFLYLAPLAFAASIAQAGSVTVSGTTGLLPTELNSDVTVAKFDTNLGTLTKVTIKYDGEIATTLTFHNKNANAENFSYNFGSNFMLSSSDSAVNGLLSGLGLNATTGNQGPITIAGNGTTTATPTNPTDSKSTSTTSVLAPFKGPGSLTFHVSTLSGLTILGGGGNVTADQTTSGKGTVTITYEYDAPAVPEPASVIMLGMAGGVLGAVSLYRKRRAS